MEVYGAVLPPLSASEPPGRSYQESHQDDPPQLPPRRHFVPLGPVPPCSLAAVAADPHKLTQSGHLGGPVKENEGQIM